MVLEKFSELTDRRIDGRTDKGETIGHPFTRVQKDIPRADKNTHTNIPHIPYYHIYLGSLLTDTH